MAVALEDTVVRDDAVAAILAVAPNLTTKIDGKGRNALHCVCAETGGADAVLVDSLLKINPTAATERDGAGESPLQLALLSGSAPGAVQQLLAAAPEEADRLTGEDTTASAVQQNVVHLAVQGGNHETVALVAEQFADKVAMCDEEDDTPLHLAIWKHDQSVIAALLASPGAAALHEGWTALHHAVGARTYATMTPTEWKDAVARMMKEEPGCDRASDRSGWLPIHVAAATECPAHVMASLIEVYPEGVMAQDVDLWIPLIIAVQDPNCPVDTIMALIEAAPDSVSFRDADGKYALHYAAEYGAQPAVLGKLIDMNRDVACVKCDEDAGSALPIHLAIVHGKVTENVVLLLDACSNSFLSPFLIDEIYKVDNLLMLALKSEAILDIVKFLVDRFPESVPALNSTDG